MTTENSGETVCSGGHSPHMKGDYCGCPDDCTCLRFRPAPENSEGSVPASTDRIQEAREVVLQGGMTKWRQP